MCKSNAGYTDVERVLRSCSSEEEVRAALRRVDPQLELIDCQKSGDLADILATRPNGENFSRMISVESSRHVEGSTGQWFRAICYVDFRVFIHHGIK